MTLKSLVAGLQITALVLIAPLSVQEAKAQQWAYNMASYNCDLLRRGVSEEAARTRTLDRFPEYQRYIDEYGFGAMASELVDQCGELLSSGSESGSGGGNGCGISIHQMEEFRRTRRLVVNC